MAKETKYGALLKVQSEMIIKGITFEQIAEAIGVTEQTARDKIKGRRDITRSEIQMLGDKLGLDINLFF